MNFKVEGKAFQQTLQAVNKVINSKNALTIYDNMLFKLENGKLSVTGSDQENTLTVTMDVVESEGEGIIALNAKTLLEITKEVASQPIEFIINEKNLSVVVRYSNGHFSFVGVNGSEYPMNRKEDENAETIEMRIPCGVVKSGVERTIYAVSPETIRPAMQGIYWDIHNDDVTFVSSDTHKLVRYINRTCQPGIERSFIMPSKPANVLMHLVSDEEEEMVIEITGKNASFKFDNKILMCRFVNGNYPDYNRVIPKESLYKVTVDRVSLLNGLRRVALFASKASSLVKFELSAGNIRLSGSDLDYSTSAEENVMCEYSGKDMVIGFNSVYTLEILQNIGDENINIELTDPARPGIFCPEFNKEGEDLVTIQMPIQVLE